MIGTPPPGRSFPPDYIARPASAALNRLLAGHGTERDLIAYRAWITWWRLNGDTGENLADAISRANGWAVQLGVE